MGAATRPAGAQPEPSRPNRPTWLIVAFVCLVTAIVYLCVSISEGLRRGETSLPAVLEVAPEVNSAPVAEAAEAPKPEAASTTEATTAAAAPRPAQMAPGRSVAIGSEELLAAIVVGAGEGAEHLSVSVRRISDGRTASLNGDFQWYAASLFKLAVLYEVERQIFEGNLTYDQQVTIAEEDYAEDLGTVGHLDIDDDGTIAVEDLLRPMIEISDNVSAVALLHLVGSSQVDATLRSLGIETMTVNRVELWTTSDDVSRLVEAIYMAEGLGATERDHMRNLLRAQTIRGGIPGALGAEIAEGLSVGNKTGTWDGAQHDVAFIEAQNGTYVIAILTDGTYEGWQAMHGVSQKVHATMLALP
jgi:beta-lactamase class A